MGFVIGLINLLLVLTSLFLICLVLIQRGKGGGLAGAFGGPGGSSAFGTKAGDVFTRITIITAGIWFALAMLSVLLVNRGESNSAFKAGPAPASKGAPTDPSAKALEDLLSGASESSKTPPIEAPKVPAGESPATDPAKAANPDLPSALTPPPTPTPDAAKDKAAEPAK